MVWTGSKALCAVVIGEIILRLITVIWFFRITVRCLLRVKNSKTMIRKARQGADKWKQITLLCFWNAKSDQQWLLRGLIGIYNYMLFTILLPLIAMILYYVKLCPMEVVHNLFAVHFYMDMLISIPVEIYTLRRFGRK